MLEQNLLSILSHILIASFTVSFASMSLSAWTLLEIIDIDENQSELS